jgi:hypothetical protein
MKKLAPEVEELKKKYKKNSPEQNAAVWALYRERGVHPPETCVEPGAFFAEIGRRGMRVSVSREEPLGV